MAGGAPQGYADGGILGQGFGGAQPLQFGQQTNPNPQFNTQSTYNNFASPNQDFMSYPQQGQPNQQAQPPQQTQAPQAPQVQSSPSPDRGGDNPSNNMGYDNSGSDAGVGGQPVNQIQSPLQGHGNGQPPRLSQFMPHQGLHIQGNPTSMPVQYTQQR